MKNALRNLVTPLDGYYLQYFLDHGKIEEFDDRKLGRILKTLLGATIHINGSSDAAPYTMLWVTLEKAGYNGIYLGNLFFPIQVNGKNPRHVYRWQAGLIPANVSPRDLIQNETPVLIVDGNSTSALQAQVAANRHKIDYKRLGDHFIPHIGFIKNLFGVNRALRSSYFHGLMDESIGRGARPILQSLKAAGCMSSRQDVLVCASFAAGLLTKFGGLLSTNSKAGKSSYSFSGKSLGARDINLFVFHSTGNDSLGAFLESCEERMSDEYDLGQANYPNAREYVRRTFNGVERKTQGDRTLPVKLGRELHQDFSSISNLTVLTDGAGNIDEVTILGELNEEAPPERQALYLKNEEGQTDDGQTTG